MLALNLGLKRLARFCSLATLLGGCENKPGLACWVTETQVEYSLASRSARQLKTHEAAQPRPAYPCPDQKSRPQDQQTHELIKCLYFAGTDFTGGLSVPTGN